MPHIRIDGVEYEVATGKNLLQSCLELGLDLPYFCWHPAMGSVGACRQCAVVQHADEDDTQGRIVMGCMTPVTDGAVFSLSGDRAAKFRTAVVESLMLNHPHDCPVCAEGGECHLQDMTVMVGHRDRHYRGRKNTHRNQHLGPLIHHEMNRCITCYRCTRYYRDYAGGTDLAAMAARDHIYFGRHEEGALESPFAGNLVEVCPTGVFTDKALVHEYTRKWDLQSAPSVCVGCGWGCNTLPGERYGKLKRIHNRYNSEVNGYFLCDRGRFGGQFANSEQRMNHAGVKGEDGKFSAIGTEQALERAAEHCRDRRVAGIGSPRASLEANHCLRELVGAENFHSGMSDGEHELAQRALAHLASTPARNPSLQDIESADAVLVLGEDVTHTAPRLALALRQSVRNLAFELAADMKLEPWQDAAIRNLAQDRLSPLHLVCAGGSDLEDIAASAQYLAAPDQVLFADKVLAALGGKPSGDACADAVAADLSGAKRPLVVVGTACGNGALLDRAAAIAGALADRGGMLSISMPECNSLGVALLTQGSQNAASGNWRSEPPPGRSTPLSFWKTTFTGGPTPRWCSNWCSRWTPLWGWIAWRRRPWTNAIWCCPLRPSPRGRRPWSTRRGAPSAPTRCIPRPPTAARAGAGCATCNAAATGKPPRRCILMTWSPRSPRATPCSAAWQTPRRTTTGAARDSRCRASPTATAAAPPCGPMCRCTSPSNWKTRTPRWPTPWKAPAKPTTPAHCCPMSGRRGGTPTSPSTSSSPRWGAACAAARRGCACWTPCGTSRNTIRGKTRNRPRNWNPRSRCPPRRHSAPRAVATRKGAFCYTPCTGCSAATS